MSLLRFNARLINLPWLHGIKTRHEQQKEPNYLKNRPFSKSYNYFWNAYKELPIKMQKNLILEHSSGGVLKKHCWSLFF